MNFMKNLFLILALAILPVIGLNAQTVVKIGSQTWTAENLNVSTFRNGDPIMEVKTYEEWKKAKKDKIPAFCHYNNDSTNGKKYGKLYNAYAILDPRGLAPKEFHLPSVEEWAKLGDELGGWKQAGDKLKNSSEWDGTNSTGFNAKPAGIRYSDGPNGFGGTYATLGEIAYFWASNTRCSFYFKTKKSYLGKMDVLGGCFLSARCIAD
jgi:uncharacterized protein (TIGR02145 family)